MKKDSEFWAEEVLESIHGMERAQMPDALNNRILNAVKTKGRQIPLISSRQLKWAVAASVLLIGINAYTLWSRKSNFSIQDSQAVKNNYGFSSEELIKL